jgi:MoxR-like ATPase
MLGAKAHALLRGRGYVLPDDVKAVAHDVLRHRILLTYLAEAEEIVVDSVIDEIIRIVPIP